MLLLVLVKLNTEILHIVLKYVNVLSYLPPLAGRYLLHLLLRIFFFTTNFLLFLTSVSTGWKRRTRTQQDQKTKSRTLWFLHLHPPVHKLLSKVRINLHALFVKTSLLSVILEEISKFINN